jgi:hypothetical protein
MNRNILFIVALVFLTISCKQRIQTMEEKSEYQQLVEQFAEVTLQADLSHLSENEKEILKIFLDISEIIDEMFWTQSYGNKEELLSKIGDENAKKYAMIHYGPWDRLNDNQSFVADYGAKPEGANFYPIDMTKEEFENWDNPDKLSMYTMIRRDDEGKLQTIWYKEFFKEQIESIVALMTKAADLAEDQGLKNYLLKRVKAFETDNYFESDMAWMDMKTANIDFVVGPIENYEDKLYGTKAAYEAFILMKDIEWSKKLERFTSLLGNLQKTLPVDAKYKKEMPGSDSDINVYEAIFYAGDCNSGSKTIAINLPNDERVHIAKGTRKLQLKNSMQAKFDKIVIPIAENLIVEEQRQNIQFNAFFENVTFHEVAHGMGIKNTINGKGTVRSALKETYSAIEEAKADIMGLYLVTRLHEAGELTEGEVMDNFVTFVASIFRSVRFGSASAHGKANMMRFNYFLEKGAIERNEAGLYKVNYDKMYEAMISSVQNILTIQGNGDYETALKLIETDGVIQSSLQKDLDKIATLNIPIDIVFIKGKEVLGL